jgi:hypothetical protein
MLAEDGGSKSNTHWRMLPREVIERELKERAQKNAGTGYSPAPDINNQPSG